MKLLLKDFQIDAVRDLVRRLRTAAVEAQSGDLQAVSLTAPTGSGKTAIATAAIEALIEGDADGGPMTEATFLWISDQPQLNLQTRRKILEMSTVLDEARMVDIDTSFDAETLEPGSLYFVNIQKLGSDKRLVTLGDRRSFTVWETISNTVSVRGGSFFVFIDEAHRGMSQSRQAQNEAATIIQKFIKGSRELPRIPLIVGISATPAKFNDLIAGTARTTRPVEVSPEDVRQSGLLKDLITLHHPREDQHADITMLRAAVESWQSYVARWASYCESQDEPPVRPILVVQVENKSGNQPSGTDLAQVLHVVNDAVGPLPMEAFAHAFEEGQKLTVDGQELRYLEPSQIALDPDVQVVLFKSSLNTGWDCPHAEVMMSFRPAKDSTAIAQLVGRMVRTPLARRVELDDFLNTVALYLPHYDEDELNNVVERLLRTDPDFMPPVGVERGENLQELSRSLGSDAAFDALTKLPSYSIPRRRRTSEVHRLMRLSRLLSNDGLDPDAPDRATAILLDALAEAYRQLQQRQDVDTDVTEMGKLDIRSVAVRLGIGIDSSDATQALPMSPENIDDDFEAAGRQLGEGLHKAWWKMRAREDPGARTQAKLEISFLCRHPAVLRAIEAVAQNTVRQWRRHHQPAMSDLPESQQQGYKEIDDSASEPEIVPRLYPPAVQLPKGDRDWARHLYVDSESQFSTRLNPWERSVIDRELKRGDLVGWLRNVDRKLWALCVPYKFEGRWSGLYPDFLVVRNVGGHLVTDILDPHNLSLADAAPKAVGLAEYATKHAHLFNRIEMITLEDGEIRALDLTDERTRERVREVTTSAKLRELFNAAP